MKELVNLFLLTGVQRCTPGDPVCTSMYNTVNYLILFLCFREMGEDDPTWIDKAFLQSVQQVDSKANVEILEFSPKPGAGPGLNYTSYIYRVLVSYKCDGTPHKQSTSLIIKKPIETGLMSEMSEDSTMLDKEQIMYQELLPNMHKKSNCEFGPKSYISPIQNIVVMEDLKERGYIMNTSNTLLDYSHCKAVFECLAKFHASSVSCYHDEPELVSECVGVDSLWVDSSVMKHWIISAVKCTVKVITEMDVDKKFKDFLLRRSGHIWDSIKASIKPKRKGINVLNHGDLWVNNIMFAFDESNNVTGVKLLDFQNTKYAPPVIDLLYFMWTSASEDVLQNCQKDLYEVYRSELNSTLEQLGCQETLLSEELWDDLRASKDWVLFVLCFGLPLQRTTPEDVLDLSTFTTEDFNGRKFQKLFDGKYYRLCLPSFAKHFTEFFL